MAKLPLDLLKLPDAVDESRAKLDSFYEKLLGLCRWFRIGVNGVLFPLELGDSLLDMEYSEAFLLGSGGKDRERRFQFLQSFERILRDQDLAFEGVFELLSSDEMVDDWRLVKATYCRRPFWRWYK